MWTVGRVGQSEGWAGAPMRGSGACARLESVNRLGSATSPYLLQHADNPVDWWEWGEAAFEEARRRDVPLLISVGYAACHWCHVMAHESFEDAEVAGLVNQHVVAVKVDREERPDVDAVYMAATQALTGQGGWPMTVFATPDGVPFYAGTYYPRPMFMRLVRAVADAWRDQRDEVVQQGAAIADVVAQSQAGGLEKGPVTPELLDAAVQGLGKGFDETYAGFGGAPKFPPHLVLLFLLRHHQRTGDDASLEMARTTCEAMARGGIYDQLAGGFARYSVDERWLVPHFEKMLYDNALLLRVYTQLWRLTGDALARRVASETAAFLVRDLRTPQGGFASSLDADTDGEEGRTYVWNRAELAAVLGPDDGDWAADLFDVTVAGTFEHGRSVLRLARDIDAAGEGAAEDTVQQRWRDVRARLLTARDARPQPTRDDKVVAAWAGLAVTALAEFEALTGEHRGVAARTADLLDTVHVRDGRVRRVSRDGVVGTPAGVLDDYGCLAEAFCAVHQLTGERRWLTRAGELLDSALEHFEDGRGGFHDTADDAERLMARPADPTDNATPSGMSALAAALVTYSALTGENTYREAAQRALETVAAVVWGHPRFAGYAATTAEALVSGPYEIAIATSDPEDELVATARRLAPPGAVVVAGAPGTTPLLDDRTMIDGRPTAYVCRGFVCDLPVTSVEALTQQLIQQLRKGG